MLKTEKTEVVGWEHALRGMRNPMNSWDKSDSVFGGKFSCGLVEIPVSIGPNDLSLMVRLRNAGTDHRKFMRQLTVYVDITAPLYWWKEFDTYKVGTTANSCSTMHKLHAKEFTVDDFSHDKLLHNCAMVDYKGRPADPKRLLLHIVDALNLYRGMYLQTKDKEWWWQMIQLLPSSYNQKRTVSLNYEVLTNMYHARENHKLDEWRNLCRWMESLPYAKELIVGEGN